MFFMYTSLDVNRPSSFAHIYSQQDSFHIHCGYWEWLVLCRTSILVIRPFVEEIRSNIKCVKLIWQPGSTHDKGTPALVACDVVDHLPHVFGVVGVEVSLHLSQHLHFASLMPAICLTLLLYGSLSCDQKGAFLTNIYIFGDFYAFI